MSCRVPWHLDFVSWGAWCPYSRDFVTTVKVFLLILRTAKNAFEQSFVLLHTLNILNRPSVTEFKIYCFKRSLRTLFEWVQKFLRNSLIFEKLSLLKQSWLHLQEHFWRFRISIALKALPSIFLLPLTSPETKQITHSLIFFIVLFLTCPSIFYRGNSLHTHHLKPCYNIFYRSGPW